MDSSATPLAMPCKWEARRMPKGFYGILQSITERRRASASIVVGQFCLNTSCRRAEHTRMHESKETHREDEPSEAVDESKYSASHEIATSRTSTKGKRSYDDSRRQAP